MKPISAARYVLTTVAATGLVLVGVTPTRAQIPAKWNTFSAEVTLNRYEIGADGKPAGFKAPVVTYRFERIAAPWGWRTVFSLVAAERQKVQPLKGVRCGSVSSAVSALRMRPRSSSPPPVGYGNRPWRRRGPSATSGRSDG